MSDYPIKGFLESSFLDWPGKVSAVLFLGGCNLACPFCHNPKLVNQIDNKNGFLNFSVIKNRLVKFRSWLDGVVISGGEPTIHEEKLPLLLKELKELGFKVKLDTNGGNPEVLKQLIKNDLIEAISLDVKAQLSDPFYQKASGKADFYPLVKKSLFILLESKLSYTLRTTVVPTIHSKDELLVLKKELSQHKHWHWQNFKPGNLLDPSYNNIVPYTEEEFLELKEQVLNV